MLHCNMLNCFEVAKFNIHEAIMIYDLCGNIIL